MKNNKLTGIVISMAFFAANVFGQDEQQPDPYGIWFKEYAEQETTSTDETTSGSIYTQTDVAGAAAKYFDDGTTRHLEPYAGFAFGLLPTRWKIGFASDIPIGVTEILSPKDIPGKKENGRLIFNLKKIYDNAAISSNGLDAGFEFSMRNTLLAEISFGNTGVGFSAGSIDARLDINIGSEVFKLLATGIDRGVSVYGINISGAIFAETIRGNWHKQHFLFPKLFLSISASHYIPALYIPKSNIAAALQNEGKIAAYLEGDMKIYMAGDYTKINNISDGNYNSLIETYGGVDLSLQAEYALFKILDIGITAHNIPLAPSKLKYAAVRKFKKATAEDEGKTAEQKKQEGIYDPIIEIDSLIGMADGGSTFEFNDEVLNALTDLSGYTATEEENIVTRPMRWDFYALFRPFRSDIFVLRPNIGFTMLTPAEETYFNLGIELQFNSGKWFSLALFTGGYDGIFHNRLSFDVHFWKISRIYFSLETRSQDYTGTWTIKGAAVELGYKWGGGFRGITNF
jgi:hypothetical protein